MACFDGLISIKGLCEKDSAKYYLDDIGVSLLMAAKSADEKHINGKRLIESKIKQAWEDAFNDITFDGMDAYKILNDVVVGKNTNDSLAPFLGYRGLKFVLDKNCNLSRFFVHKISLSVKVGGQVKIIIRQGTNDSEIFNGTLQDNQTVEILINDFVTNSFEVLATNDNVEVFSGSKFVDCNCNTISYFSVNGNLDNSENYGFVVDLQLRCDKYNYLCKFVDKIAKAVQYKAAALIWKSIWDSNRFNDFLSMKKENAITEMAFLDSTYNLLKYDPEVAKNAKELGMYQKELEKIKIPKPTCRCCLECESDSYVFIKP